MMMLGRFWRDEEGATLVEMTITIVLLLTLTLGFVDFGHALYQWNAASKAVQSGARLAAVSSPVIDGVATATDTLPAEPPGTAAGDIVAPGAYTFSCVGAGSPACNANFDRIYRGDAAGTGCPALAANQRPGMCHFFPRLQPANIRVTYTASGLGYWTRPGGPVPTITVSLQNMNFQFFFLSGLLGFTNITMPSMLSTVTGEDMKSTAP
jgi:Flp pilus assembly protein TadG